MIGLTLIFLGFHFATGLNSFSFGGHNTLQLDLKGLDFDFQVFAFLDEDGFLHASLPQFLKVIVELNALFVKLCHQRNFTSISSTSVESVSDHVSTTKQSRGVVVGVVVLVVGVVVVVVAVGGVDVGGGVVGVLVVVVVAVVVAVVAATGAGVVGEGVVGVVTAGADGADVGEGIVVGGGGSGGTAAAIRTEHSAEMSLLFLGNFHCFQYGFWSIQYSFELIHFLTTFFDLEFHQLDSTVRKV